MSNILFLDKMQQVIKSYDSNEFMECVQTKEITTNASELMNDTLSVSLPFDEIIKDASYIAVNDTKEREFSLYRILTPKDEDDLLSFEAINFAVDELDNFIIKDVRPKDMSFSYVINQLLSDSGCDWVLGVCEPIKTVSTTFYYSSIREALKSLQELGAEFTFSIEISGNKITKKIIHCYNKIGKITNKRFEYGEEVLKIVHQQDRTNIVTALIGRGKGEEVGDGYGRRIEFSDVEWKKSNGKPLDKPKGQNWIEYPEMTEKYGIPSNGKMLPRKTVVVFDDVEDASELLQKTYDQLAYYCRPLVQFSTEILGSDSIGNTVSIHRGDRNYHYQTRVFKVVTDYVNGRAQASLGDNLSGNSINRQLSRVQNNISDLDSNKMTWYDSTEIGKYQDDIMRGAGKNGGSIYMVNGIEAGVSQSRETYEQVFMDGPKIQDSQYFMIQNNAGISFKQCNKGEWTTVQDVHNGSSNTAWTLDGTFNANFINAGVLQGIKIRSINGEFIVELYDGKIRFIKKDGSSEKEMFAFGPAYVNGQLQGINAIQNQGYSFAISSKNDDGTFLNVLEIPKDSTATDRKLKLFGKVNIEGNLYVNGTEITGNSGGSGEIPGELTTEKEKNAWAIWSYFKSIGYSEQAVSGMLGNIDAESGIMPDTDQLYGPAYGLVQWDGSAYPLYGPNEPNGRLYVQNLLRAAEISGDYRNITTQIKLIEWCMHNGQWIGAVNPLSVDGFKAETDINNATYAFLKNFERAGIENLAYREEQANYWYNRLHGLNPSTGTWRNPVRSSYSITQEWDQIGYGTGEIHGGIDVASIPVGSTPNIYAARSGTVTTVTFDETGGNYVIVQHADGYWSYYGHLSSVSVSVGDSVTTNTVVGIMGQTGLATGVHLHFEVWKDTQWNRINPRDVINF